VYPQVLDKPGWVVVALLSRCWGDHLRPVAHLDLRMFSHDFDARQTLSHVVGLQDRAAICDRQNRRATTVRDMIPPSPKLPKFRNSRPLRLIISSDIHHMSGSLTESLDEKFENSAYLESKFT
jgi:hypothetical protein